MCRSNRSTGRSTAGCGVEQRRAEIHVRDATLGHLRPVGALGAVPSDGLLTIDDLSWCHGPIVTWRRHKHHCRYRRLPIRSTHGRSVDASDSRRGGRPWFALGGRGGTRALAAGRLAPNRHPRAPCARSAVPPGAPRCRRDASRRHCGRSGSQHPRSARRLRGDNEDVRRHGRGAAAARWLCQRQHVVPARGHSPVPTRPIPTSPSRCSRSGPSRCSTGSDAATSMSPC